jgi:hypothetical protein
MLQQDKIQDMLQQDKIQDMLQQDTKTNKSLDNKFSVHDTFLE